MAFDQRKNINTPDWADNLRHIYWLIRNDGRSQAKRRKYYRQAQKEKLRLAELGFCQNQIKQLARYYSNFKNYKKAAEVLSENSRQLTLF